MPLPLNPALSIVFILLVLSVTGYGGAPAAGSGLPQRFDVEVFPAIHTAKGEQEPVVYHFDGEQVRAHWKRKVVFASTPGKGNVQLIMTTEMTGTFRNGVLEGEQVSEETRIDPPGSYGDDFPGGPIARVIYKGVIEGRL